MLYSSLQSKYGVLKRHAEKIEMEMTQMHLWQAQAMEGMDEDFGDGMSVSFSPIFCLGEGRMYVDGLLACFCLDTCIGRIQN